MSIERTLSIIKPDAVGKNLVGEIFSRFEKAGLKIIALKMLHLSREQAEGFYAEHKGKGFFEPLMAFMTSGPICVQVLEGDDAIQTNRTLMGADEPAGSRSWHHSSGLRQYGRCKRGPRQRFSCISGPRNRILLS